MIQKFVDYIYKFFRIYFLVFSNFFSDIFVYGNFIQLVLVDFVYVIGLESLS